MFTMLCNTYSKQVTKELMTSFHFALMEMDEVTFTNNIIDIMRTRESTFFPTAAEILNWNKPVELLLSGPSDDEVKAKGLIALVENMNNQIFNDAKAMGVPFVDLLDKVTFPKIDDATIAILNQVKPHCSLKRLIGNINTYQTSVEQLKAFKNALKQNDKIGFIENAEIKKRIGK